MFIPVRIIVKFDHVKVDRIINSSPIKLIDGGKAKLVKVARVHHMAISGRIDCRPRARIIVRLWIRS